MYAYSRFSATSRWMHPKASFNRFLSLASYPKPTIHLLVILQSRSPACGKVSKGTWNEKDLLPTTNLKATKRHGPCMAFSTDQTAPPEELFLGGLVNQRRHPLETFGTPSLHKICFFVYHRHPVADNAFLWGHHFRGIPSY